MGKQFLKDNWDGTNRAGQSKTWIVEDNIGMLWEVEYGLCYEWFMHEIKLKRNFHA